MENTIKKIGEFIELINSVNILDLMNLNSNNIREYKTLLNHLKECIDIGLMKIEISKVEKRQKEREIRDREREMAWKVVEFKRM